MCAWLPLGMNEYLRAGGWFTAHSYIFPCQSFISDRENFNTFQKQGNSISVSLPILK